VTIWWRNGSGPGDRTDLAAAGDYLPEMPVLDRIDDPTAEALLAGRPVPPALDPLAEVLATYRQAGHRPVPPPAELAAWLVTGRPPGEIPDGGAVPVWMVRTGGQRRRRRMPGVGVLAGVAAKLAGMSVAAKAMAGVAVAAAGVTSAGLAGALPEPAQDRFETVVESVTPVDVPAPAGPASEFGERVSEDARDGGVDGSEVSEEARQLGERLRPTELPPVVPELPAKPGLPAELPTPDQTGQPGPPDGLPGPGIRPTPPPGR